MPWPIAQGNATAPDLAATADRTGDATAPDLLKKEPKKKSPKKSGNFAATVERGATDASILSKSRYPSRGTGKMTSTGKGASSFPIAEDDAHALVPAGNAPKIVAKSTAAKSNELYVLYYFIVTILYFCFTFKLVLTNLYNIVSFHKICPLFI